MEGRDDSQRGSHKASKKELDELRAVIARDLEGAAIQELSDDRRFTPGHHRLTLEAARLALGASAARHLDFFEACRRKRNVIDYDHASVATHTEADEMVAEANNFFELVARWISANHPKLNPLTTEAAIRKAQRRSLVWRIERLWHKQSANAQHVRMRYLQLIERN